MFNVLLSRKTTLFSILLSLFLFGCQLLKNKDGTTDWVGINNFVTSLDRAGFAGQFNLNVNSKIEVGIKEAAYLNGPIDLIVSGQINPKAEDKNDD